MRLGEDRVGEGWLGEDRVGEGWFGEDRVGEDWAGAASGACRVGLGAGAGALHFALSLP